VGPGVEKNKKKQTAFRGQDSVYKITYANLTCNDTRTLFPSPSYRKEL